MVAVGHAIVDRIGFVDDAVLAASDLVKGSMRLVGSPEDLTVDGAGPPKWQWAAGSAGNTAAGLAMLGSAVCFVGRVGDDDLGATYRADMGGLGAQVQPDLPVMDSATGQCLVLVTPDGERTMTTYLGASTSLGPDDLSPDLVASARVLYAEGYLWDSPSAVEAIHAVLSGPGRPLSGPPEADPTEPSPSQPSPSQPSLPGPAHHMAGSDLSPAFALSLSDPFCVERHRDAFMALVTAHVGVLFANEAEILALTGAGDFDAAVAEARGWGCVVAITRAAAGSVVIQGEHLVSVSAVSVSEVVDTTGAGDLYAAGFLHGLVNGYDLERCAQLGSLAASEIIGHVGARPLVSLRSLAEEASLLPPYPGEA